MLLLWNLRIGGLLLCCLGISHAFMPSHFGWARECGQLTPLTREIHYVHHAYIGLTCFLCGALCLFFAPDLIARSHLALVVLLGLLLFWGSRLLVQLFVYSASLWRGKRFETVVHVAFCGLWLYLTVVFAVGVYIQAL